MPTIVPLVRISMLEKLRNTLGDIQINIAEERLWIVDRNYGMGLTDDDYVALMPTSRFNRLYNEAFMIIDRIERLTR